MAPIRLLLVLALLPIMGCVQGGPVAGRAEGDAETRIVEPYRLGAADKLRIATFGEPSLSGEFDVSASGMVVFPLIGAVQAGGLTTDQLATAIATQLRQGYLKDPKITVELLNYRPFYILGEVNKPGEYPYAPGLTVLKAVAIANGFTYRANSKRVFIKRPDEVEENSYRLTASTPVAPGDIIRIGERFF